jgi:predicted lactoylglutathione lyase
MVAFYNWRAHQRQTAIRQMGRRAMSKMIFVNLPVADLDRSIAFYEAIGATRNAQFSDDTAACMVLSDVIHVMILTHKKFAQFTPKRIADAHESSEVLICISCDSREAVDQITEAALGAGRHVTVHATLAGETP